MFLRYPKHNKKYVIGYLKELKCSYREKRFHDFRTELQSIVAECPKYYKEYNNAVREILKLLEDTYLLLMKRIIRDLKDDTFCFAQEYIKYFDYFAVSLPYMYPEEYHGYGRKYVYLQLFKYIYDRKHNRLCLRLLRCLMKRIPVQLILEYKCEVHMLKNIHNRDPLKECYLAYYNALIDLYLGEKPKIKKTPYDDEVAYLAAALGYWDVYAQIQDKDDMYDKKAIIIQRAWRNHSIRNLKRNINTLCKYMKASPEIAHVIFTHSHNK